MSVKPISLTHRQLGVVRVVQYNVLLSLMTRTMELLSRLTNVLLFGLAINPSILDFLAEMIPRLSWEDGYLVWKPNISVEENAIGNGYHC